MSGYVIDLTREEGARILEKEAYLYSYVERIKDKFKNILNGKRKGDVEEFFNSNFFIDGSRGTGKTTILVTLRNELKNILEDAQKLETLEILNLSLNNTSIVIYLLGYLHNKINNEEFMGRYFQEYHRNSIFELYSKLINGFPHFLKCLKDYNYAQICEEDIENILAKLEVDFVISFKEFIELYKKITNKEIVIFLDDIDLVKEPEILYRTFVELSVVLSSKYIHIVGAGDLNNIYKILESFFRRNTCNNIEENHYREESSKIIAKSFIDKVFPLSNRIKLENLSVVDLSNLKIKIKEDSTNEDSRKTLLEFLSYHPTFNLLIHKLKKRNFIYYLFEGYSLRDFIQVLRNIKEEIELISKNQRINIKQILISDIFCKFIKEFDTEILTFPEIDIYCKVKRNNKDNGINEIDIEFINISDEAIKKLKLYNEILARNFYKFIDNLINTDREFRKIFDMENEKDLVGRNKINIFKSIFSYNKRLYSLIYIWLLEIFYYMKGHLFFLPYLILFLSITYGVPNIFKILEKRGHGSRLSSGKESGTNYEEFLNPTKIIKYLSSFIDTMDLLYIMHSIHVDVNTKNYTVIDDVMKKFLIHNDLPSYIDLSKRIVPCYYKFWFLPLLSIYYNDLKEKSCNKETNKEVNNEFLSNIIFNKFITIFEEDDEEIHLEENKSKKENLEKILEGNLQKILEITFDALKSLFYEYHQILNPEDIDLIIFTYVKSMTQSLLKQNISNYPKVKLAIYHVISTAFYLVTINKSFFGEARKILDMLEGLAIISSHSSKEEKDKIFFKRFYKELNNLLKLKNKRDIFYEICKVIDELYFQKKNKENDPSDKIQELIGNLFTSEYIDKKILLFLYYILATIGKHEKPRKALYEELMKLQKDDKNESEKETKDREKVIKGEILYRFITNNKVRKKFLEILDEKFKNDEEIDKNKILKIALYPIFINSDSENEKP